MTEHTLPCHTKAARLPWRLALPCVVLATLASGAFAGCSPTVASTVAIEGEHQPHCAASVFE